MSQVAGLAHEGCGQRADHFPHLDVAYCAACGWQRRMDAVEFERLRKYHDQMTATKEATK